MLKYIIGGVALVAIGYGLKSAEKTQRKIALKLNL